MSKGRKQVAFDLDTNQLKKYYPNEHWTNAYRDIKTFMTKNNFQWEQGSVYISKIALNPHEINAIMCGMVNTFPWLNVCMRDCVVTNIGRSHSQNHIFDKTADIKPRESVEKDNILSMLEDVVRSDKIENDFDFGDEELEK